MSRGNSIQYGIDLDTGYYVSRTREGVCLPIIDFANMIPDDGFEIKLFLEKHNAFEVLPHMNIKWTRKIPVETKNIHREFWGMKAL